MNEGSHKWRENAYHASKKGRIDSNYMLSKKIIKK